MPNHTPAELPAAFVVTVSSARIVLAQTGRGEGSPLAEALIEGTDRFRVRLIITTDVPGCAALFAVAALMKPRIQQLLVLAELDPLPFSLDPAVIALAGRRLVEQALTRTLTAAFQAGLPLVRQQIQVLTTAELQGMFPARGTGGVLIADTVPGRGSTPGVSGEGER